MSYRFINPGYRDMFEGNAGKQVTGNKTYNPNNGVAFSGAGYGGTRASYTVKESENLYVSFGWYIPADYYDSMFSTNTILSVSALKVSTATFRINIYSKPPQNFAISFEKLGNDHSKDTTIDFDPNLYKGSYNRFYVHMSSNDGSVEVWMNGKMVARQEGLAFKGEKITGNVVFLSGYYADHMFLSNFIISDEHVAPNEDVMLLPAGAVEAPSSKNEDGTYTLRNAGEEILQVTDASVLKDTDIITGLAAIAAPGYTKGDGIYYMRGVVKDKEGKETLHDTVAIGSHEQGVIGVGWTENMSRSQLDGLKIGLRAEAE